MNEQYDEMERYLSGEMSEQELAAFSLKLSTDEELAAEVAVMKMARESIGRQAATEAEVAELRKVMGEAAGALPQRKPVIKQLWFRLAGAGVAAALALLLWLNWPQDGTLYHQYAEHPRLAMVQRGNDDGPDLVIALEAAFNGEDYLNAGQLIEDYAAANGWNSELRLFAGICQLEQQQYSAAEEQFSLLYQGESANKWAGAWYLALTYLQAAEAGNKSAYRQCEQVLREIPAGTDYSERAGKLLEALNGPGME
jgi:hypothetical protein